MAKDLDLERDVSPADIQSTLKHKGKGMQIAIQPLQKALEEINRKVEKLQEKYALNRSKYRTAYHAAKELRDNLKHNLEWYNQKKIDALTFTGLNHLHINQAQQVLEKKFSGWGSKFFNALKNAANRFLSFVGVTKRSLENELTGFQEKVRKLKKLLLKPNQEKLANYIVKLNPSNLEVLDACHRLDPSSIKGVAPTTIIELMDKGTITPSEAIQAFPENEEIIAKAERETRFNAAQTEEEIVNLISTGHINPFLATQKCPNRPAIVEAAYKKNPATIKHASLATINQLGADGIIKVEDVLSIFSVKMPNPEAIQKETEQFNKAREDKNWAKVAEICNSDKFWFEKPEGASHESIAQDLYWQNLYDFESIAKEEDYQLTYGPLNKLPETYQLEELFRKMMQGGDFKRQTINKDDYFVFEDGTRFNWTKIREKANWQHIDLDKADFLNYSNYISSLSKFKSDLYSSLENEYIRELYKGQAIPSDPINFQQMEAMNIYTGGFYKFMNGLMRDETTKFDYRTAEPNIVRDALVHSVMCSSALRMLPLTPIRESYRSASFGTPEEQRKRVRAAAKKEVIALDGFVSSSITRGDVPFTDKKNVMFTFKNLRGVYVAPISRLPYENEFLIPPSQIQVTSYKFEGPEWKHEFEASLVSELGVIHKDDLSPLLSESSALKAANPATIIALINKGSIPPERGVNAFPRNMEVILAAYQKDPLAIREADPSLIYQELPNLVKENKVKLEDIIVGWRRKAQQNDVYEDRMFGLAAPTYADIVALACKMDPSLIKKESSEKIIELLEEGIISPAAAVNAFPDNAAIIKKAESKAGTLMIHFEKELVDRINNGQLSPYAAVQSNPTNIAVVAAAYKKNSASIKNASIEVINKLGTENVIKAADVLQVFSISMPTDTELKQARVHFTKAMKEKDWVAVAKICDKFWFERPPNTSREDVVKELISLNDSSRWENLYGFELAMKKEEYQLTQGPLQKSPETVQLETLFRKMMEGGNFKIENSADGDYFVFEDGARFNWTKIREGADLQHIELNPEDFALYNQFAEKNVELLGRTCALEPSKEKQYREELYHYAGQEIPADPIRYAEMQAINMYTGGFYLAMNGLMRDEIAKFNYRTCELSAIRAALVYSVLCASGLRKIPTHNIQASYRGGSFGSKEEQQKRIQAAANRGVLALDGFVSSSTDSAKAFDKPVIYTLTNLRGLYIAPISQGPWEKEFLIPPTQVQLTGFKFDGYKYFFEGALVSELGVKNKENFNSLVIPKETVLNFAKPEVVMTLLEKGEILPARAVEAFPEDKQIVLAAFNKDPNSIEYASPTLIEALEKGQAEKEPSKIESLALLDVKLFKIKNAYIKEEKPNEHYIRELGKAIGQGGKEAEYVIDRIINNKELCNAFGTDYAKFKEDKVADIKEVLSKSLEGKPLFVEKVNNQQSHH